MKGNVNIKKWQSFAIENENENKKKIKKGDEEKLQDRAHTNEQFRESQREIYRKNGEKYRFVLIYKKKRKKRKYKHKHRQNS